MNSLNEGNVFFSKSEEYSLSLNNFKQQRKSLPQRRRYISEPSLSNVEYKDFISQKRISKLQHCRSVNQRFHNYKMIVSPCYAVLTKTSTANKSLFEIVSVVTKSCNDFQIYESIVSSKVVQHMRRGKPRFRRIPVVNRSRSTETEGQTFMEDKTLISEKDDNISVNKITCSENDAVIDHNDNQEKTINLKDGDRPSTMISPISKSDNRNVELNKNLLEKEVTNKPEDLNKLESQNHSMEKNSEKFLNNEQIFDADHNVGNVKVNTQVGEILNSNPQTKPRATSDLSVITPQQDIERSNEENIFDLSSQLDTLDSKRLLSSIYGNKSRIERKTSKIQMSDSRRRSKSKLTPSSTYTVKSNNILDQKEEVVNQMTNNDNHNPGKSETSSKNNGHVKCNSDNLSNDDCFTPLKSISKPTLNSSSSSDCLINEALNDFKVPKQLNNKLKSCKHSSSSRISNEVLQFHSPQNNPCEKMQSRLRKSKHSVKLLDEGNNAEYLRYRNLSQDPSNKAYYKMIKYRNFQKNKFENDLINKNLNKFNNTTINEEVHPHTGTHNDDDVNQNQHYYQNSRFTEKYNPYIHQKNLLPTSIINYEKASMNLNRSSKNKKCHLSAENLNQKNFNSWTLNESFYQTPNKHKNSFTPDTPRKSQKGDSKHLSHETSYPNQQNPHLLLGDYSIHNMKLYDRLYRNKATPRHNFDSSQSNNDAINYPPSQFKKTCQFDNTVCSIHNGKHDNVKVFENTFKNPHHVKSNPNSSSVDQHTNGNTLVNSKTCITGANHLSENNNSMYPSIGGHEYNQDTSECVQQTISEMTDLNMLCLMDKKTVQRELLFNDENIITTGCLNSTEETNKQINHVESHDEIPLIPPHDDSHRILVENISFYDGESNMDEDSPKNLQLNNKSLNLYSLASDIQKPNLTDCSMCTNEVQIKETCNENLESSFLKESNNLKNQKNEASEQHSKKKSPPKLKSNNKCIKTHSNENMTNEGENFHSLLESEFLKKMEYLSQLERRNIELSMELEFMKIRRELEISHNETNFKIHKMNVKYKHVLEKNTQLELESRILKDLLIEKMKNNMVESNRNEDTVDLRKNFSSSESKGKWKVLKCNTVHIKQPYNYASFESSISDEIDDQKIPLAFSWNPKKQKLSPVSNHNNIHNVVEELESTNEDYPDYDDTSKEKILEDNRTAELRYKMEISRNISANENNGNNLSDKTVEGMSTNNKTSPTSTFKNGDNLKRNRFMIITEETTMDDTVLPKNKPLKNEEIYDEQNPNAILAPNEEMYVKNENPERNVTNDLKPN